MIRPHFSTFGKNYTRRFKDTDLFEQIFQRILEECYRFKLVDSTEIFVDATHVKARANNRKMQKRIANRKLYFMLTCCVRTLTQTEKRTERNR